MNDLMLQEAAGIRRTMDGRASVFDMLEAAGAKSPREVFRRLEREYPEVVTKCHNFRFKGQGQRMTPVADAAGWRRILTVLPGVLGKQYRATVNQMVDQFFDDPEALNTRTLERIEDPEALKRVELRARTKRTNKGVNAQIFSRGGSQQTAAQVANINNLAVTGHIAADLKTIRKVKETREGFSNLELSLMAVAEELEIAALQQSEVFGHDGIVGTVGGVARDVSALRRKYSGALPHPHGGLIQTSI